MSFSDEITLSVHKFIELVAKEGDLTSSFFSQKRAVDGTKGHQKVQKQRGEDYQAEIPISCVFQDGSLKLCLEGRIDGIFQTENNSILEEIKTTEGDIPQNWDETPLLHRAQLICYGAMWNSSHNENISLRLTYFHLYKKVEVTIDAPLDKVGLDKIFNKYLANFFYIWKIRRDWMTHRDESSRKLKFPFNDFRASQRDFSVSVYKNIQEDGVLLAQAPTGTGKTMGTLFPAVKAWGEGLIQRILYLTAKTTGREMANEALNLLEAQGLTFTSVTLTAKEQICLSPDSIRCNAAECLYARGFYDKLKVLFPLFRRNKRWEKESLIELCDKEKICPFELSMEWALEADIVIGDFNHLFDPIVSLKRFFQREDQIALLVDEAHNLPDRARDLYSSKLDKKTILSYRRSLKDSFPGLGKSLGKINNLFLELWKELEKEKDKLMVTESLQDHWINPLKKIQAECETLLRESQNLSQRQLCTQLYFEIRFFLFIEALAGPTHRFISRNNGKNCSIEYICLDPSPFITESLEKCQSAVFFSATLHPMEYFSQLLLRDRQYKSIDIPSPFPQKNCLVLNRRDIDTRYQHRKKSLPLLLESLFTLWNQYPGHQIAFFPSYAYMEDAASLWREQYSIPLEVQWKKMSLEERENFLDHFNQPEPKLVFAVMGGIFSEGIDLKGNMLSALSIVSIGFPSFSLERELIRDYFQEKCSRGFDFAYRYPGWHRVLQAAGRLIRSEKDQGVILLAGSRFNELFYRNLYPWQWQPVEVLDNGELMEKRILSFRNELWDS